MLRVDVLSTNNKGWRSPDVCHCLTDQTFIGFGDENKLGLNVSGRQISNSYAMACPPVRGDNPRALASGLSYVQMDKQGITILYHLHKWISVDLVHHEIFHAKVGKGGITYNKQFTTPFIYTKNVRGCQVGKVSTNFAAAKNGKVGSNFSAAKNGQVSSNSKKR